LELHNHPWRKSISFILSGKYLEQRLIDGKVVERILSPGKFNYIKANDFHRVELVTKRVWTLFISGSKDQDWGFIDTETKNYTPWQEHTTKKRM